MNRIRWAVIVAYFTAAIFAGGAVQYSTWKSEQTIEESNQRWCQLLSVLDSAYRAVPPTTPTGRTVAAEIHKLHGEFHC